VKHCKWCDNTFQSDINYQIYCSSTCRDQATKQNIANRYNATKRQKRLGKERKCKSCEKDLSIYNDDVLCSECLINPIEVKKALKQLKGFINGTK
jgi:hypothetical protein